MTTVHDSAGTRLRQARATFDAAMAAFLDGVGRPTRPDDYAARAFTRATELAPELADAWLGRAACGDTTPDCLFHLYKYRHAMLAEQRRLGLAPRTLTGRFATGFFIDYPLADPVEAAVAYACSMIAERDFDGAAEVLDATQSELPDADRRPPIIDFTRAGLHFTTQRWPDVLASLASADSWSDELMMAAASLMTGTACAQLGLFGEAIKRLEAAQAGPLPSVHVPAMFTHGLCLRELGDEEQARALFEDVYARRPDFADNAAALSDTGFRLVVVSREAIDARTDRWDPASTPTADADPADDLLADAQRQLDAQVGLESVKLQVDKLRSAATVAQIRAAKGLSGSARTQHLVFTGPPGTGKTTIARIVATIYRGLGMLHTDTVVEASRRDFVGEHLGATAIKTGALIDRALDGVLLIDEAYTLNEAGLSGGDAFGREAVDTLLARMENDRDRLVVIIAGYDDEIDRFLASNDGLASRFTKRIRFDSYSPAELTAIADTIARQRDSMLTSAARELLTHRCASLCRPGPDRRRGIDVAGNGRFVRNVVEAAEEEREYRLSSTALDIATLDAEVLMRIEESDLDAALTTVLSTLPPHPVAE